MKIRKGFVSNSSSSSFVLYGVNLSELGDADRDIAKKCQRDTPNLDTIYGEYDTYIGVIMVGEIEHDIVGDLGDDETKNQFIIRVINYFPEELRKYADFHSESWYNG